MFTDLLIAFLSFGLAYLVRYYIQEDGEFQRQIIESRNYLFLGIILGLSQVISFLSIDLYHPRRGLSLTDEFFTIASGVIINLMFILAVLFFFRGDSFSRLVISYFAVATIVLCCLAHFALRSILRILRSKGYNLRSVLIIGTGKSAQSFAYTIKKHAIYGYTIVGYIAGKINLIENDPNFKVVGRIKDLEEYLKTNEIDLLVYALSHDEGDFLKEAIDVADYLGIDLKVVPSYEEIITAKGRVEVLDGIPIISIRNIPLRLGYNRFLKRSFDFLFSFSFLLIASPVYIAIAILIKLTSRGPIFYKQERVGLDNRKFNMLKFRSMVVQEKQASDTKWTVKDDPRVTRIGSILRKFSIDEIPQFLNVLIGDMSVVGPRPERPFFVEKFQSEHHQYMRRHAAKAGITGWAQIQGLRGDTSIEERIKADIYYIENWSLSFDIKIILLTPWKAIVDRNAY